MSCPNKNTKEFKRLSEQLGSEEAAIYVWKAYGEQYPPVTIFKSTSELKKELKITSTMTALQKSRLAARIKKYNADNGTSHSFRAVKIGEAAYDAYSIEFAIDYLPKVVIPNRNKLFNANPNWVKPKSQIIQELEKEGNLAISPDRIEGFYGTDQMLANQEYNHDRDEFDDPMYLSLEEAIDNNNKERALEFVSKLTQALNIPYEIITRAEAESIIEKQFNKPLNGTAAGFYFQDKVYLISDNINTATVFHEFAHGILKAISEQNPALLQRLYDEVSRTDEGQEIIQYVIKKYNQYSVGSKMFMEEVLAYALEKKAMQKLDNIPGTNKFNKIIKNILYHIKQFLRKVFGKAITISQLDVDTTLNDLANILVKGEKMDLKLETITREDLLQARESLNDLIADDLTNIRNQELRSIINTFYDTITEHIRTLQFNENYDELAELLLTEDNKGSLQKIKANLQAYQNKVKKLTQKKLEEFEDSRSASQALANSLIQLDKVIDLMYKHTKDLSQGTDSQENMHTAYYYDKFVKHYAGFIANLKEVLGAEENNVPADSPINAKVTSIEQNINKTESIIQKMFFKGAKDALLDQLTPVGEAVRERYEKMLEKAKVTGNQKNIDKIYKEYHGLKQADYERYKMLTSKRKSSGLSNKEQIELIQLANEVKKGVSIDEDKIELLLEGKMGDANWFNSYLEGYLYNTDPVVGGLALYIKNRMNDAMMMSQAKYNEFAQVIRPKLAKAGFKPGKLGQLGEQTTFRDKVAFINDKGELEEREVVTFLHEFKDYRYDVDRLRYNTRQAYEKYMEDTNDTTKKAFEKAYLEETQFHRDYMNQQYVNEYYDVRDLFEKDEIGVEAMKQRDAIFEAMRLLTEANVNQLDYLDTNDKMEMLWREYRQLYSRFDENGKLKSNKINPETGVSDAAVAERLREYRDNSREFYENRIRENAFEAAYFDLLAELDQEELSPEERQERINQWKKIHSRKQIKQEFYERRDNILKAIDRVLSKLPSDEKQKLDISAKYQEIFELTAPFRDETGQIQASEMTADAVQKVKQLQDEIDIIRENLHTANGLTKQESKRLDQLNKLNNANALTPELHQELRNLIEKIKQARKEGRILTKVDKALLSGWYQELAAMQDRDATDDYLIVVNNLLGSMEDNEFYKEFRELGVDKGNADYLLDYDFAQSLMEQSEDFRIWFEANHRLKQKMILDENGQYVSQPIYERLYVWSETKPSDPAYMESYPIYDASGTLMDTVDGLPGMQYYTRVVKPEYRTRKIIGTTVDNQYNWLPKTMEQGAKDSKYMNERYQEIKKDPALFDVLETLKEYHLRYQEGLAKGSKLYYDVPRYRKHTLELARSNMFNKAKEKGSAFKAFLARARAFIWGGEDDYEDGLSWDKKAKLVRLDMFDDEISDIPISGIYSLPIDDISLDVTTSMMRYMLSADRQRQLVNISPVVRGIQAAVNDPKAQVVDSKKVSKRELENRNFLKFLNIKRSVRKMAVNNLVEREFEGKTQKDFTTRFPFLHRFANLLFKRASFAFFAFNIPSALKNSYGMKFQGLLEATAGDYINHVNLQKGNAWAVKTMGLLSFSIYSRDAKPHDIQLMDAFEMIQDKLGSHTFGQEISRTVLKDALDPNLSSVFSFRKWVEGQAELQLGAGILYQNKVEITDEQGNTTTIPYIQAFETVDGILRLKAGVDVRYGLQPVKIKITDKSTVEDLAKQYNVPEEVITKALRGKTFEEILEDVEFIELKRKQELSKIDLSADMSQELYLKLKDKVDSINRKYDQKIAEKGSITIDNDKHKFIKNRIHQVLNNLDGAYARFDQPEAQRYLAFRFVSFIRRYFTPMATHRWGFSGKIWDPRPRFNPGLGDVQMGFYVQTIKILLETIRSAGSNILHLSPAEKSALLKTGSEFFMLYALVALMGILFGWDDEDEDRYEKLRQKSGPLPFPLTRESDREFNPAGYLEVHALHLLMQIRAENEQFNLFAGGLKDYNKLLDVKSVAFGPTTDTYTQMLYDLKYLIEGDPKGRYTRAVGPYYYQDEGSIKAFNRLAKSFGFTGTSIDPALAIQNFQSYQSRVRT